MKSWSMKDTVSSKSESWECAWYLGELQIAPSSTETLNKKVMGLKVDKLVSFL